MPSCFMLLPHFMRLAASRTFCTAGSSKPIRMPMMAMTTSSSIRVKAERSMGRVVMGSSRCGLLGRRQAGQVEIQFVGAGMDVPGLLALVVVLDWHHLHLLVNLLAQHRVVVFLASLAEAANRHQVGAHDRACSFIEFELSVGDGAAGAGTD